MFGSAAGGSNSSLFGAGPGALIDKLTGKSKDPATPGITVTPHTQVAQTKATALDSLRGFSFLKGDATGGVTPAGGSTYQRLLR